MRPFILLAIFEHFAATETKTANNVGSLHNLHCIQLEVEILDNICTKGNLT
jgi:hypothetical protein